MGFNYKRIFKNSEKRVKLMQALSFVPDSIMLRLQYWIKTGRRLNLNAPERYSEKVQKYKMCYKNPIMKKCADKYAVREYLEERGYGQYLNEIYGVYTSPKDIDFEKLPKQFVLKDTLGSGDDSMIIVTDKDKLDISLAKIKMNKWVNEPTHLKNPGREWVYDGVKHRIIAEKLLITDENGDLPDYKFFCFDGKVFCLYMMKNYTMHHEAGVLGFLNRDFELLPVRRKDFAPMTVQPKKPDNYDLMVKMAEELSKPFPHVRVDFYNISGNIIFGELTFFNASGYVEFEPDSFDKEMGNQFNLRTYKGE